MSTNRVLVTGSSGTLGSAVAATLPQNWEVVWLDLRPPAPDPTLPLDRVYTGSFLDAALVRKALTGVTAVVHSGAIPGARPPLHEVVAANVLGTFNVLDAAGESDTVERFVFISSIMVHGFHDQPPGRIIPPILPIHEDLPCCTTDCYGVSKVQGEQWCRCYANWYRKPVVVLRPSHIVGAERLDTFAAMEEPIAIPHLHDYVGVWDAARAVEQALAYVPRDGFEAFLINADDQYTRVPSVDLAKRCFPGVPPTDVLKPGANEAFGALVDCTRAKARLGWQPRYRCRR